MPCAINPEVSPLPSDVGRVRFVAVDKEYGFLLPDRVEDKVCGSKRLR